MHYFELNTNIDNFIDEYLPYASGHTVNNAEKYFDPQLLSYYSILKSPPIFDYFSLISISKDGPNESALLDFYEFAGILSPQINGLLISERFKKLLDQYVMPQNTMFYPAKLMYHGDKLNYYIFNYTFDYLAKLDYEHSTWQYSNSKYGVFNLSQGCTDLNFKILNEKHYIKQSLSDTIESNIFLKKAYFKDYVDLISVDGCARYAISERLKNAIVDANITPALIKPNELINFHFHNGSP